MVNYRQNYLRNLKCLILANCNVLYDRQEKLEQLASRFDRKAGMRETWLSENQRLVSQDNFGYDLAAVEAATKKHEAIETDINAYEERVQAVVAVAHELEQENYHDIDRINARKDNVLRLWNYLLELLKARRMRLELSLALQKIFQEMLYILDWMDEIKVRVNNKWQQLKLKEILGFVIKCIRHYELFFAGTIAV